jgi:hypothetical protein
MSLSITACVSSVVYSLQISRLTFYPVSEFPIYPLLTACSAHLRLLYLMLLIIIRGTVHIMNPLVWHPLCYTLLPLLGWNFLLGPSFSNVLHIMYALPFGREINFYPCKYYIHRHHHHHHHHTPRNRIKLNIYRFSELHSMYLLHDQLGWHTHTHMIRLYELYPGKAVSYEVDEKSVDAVWNLITCVHSPSCCTLTHGDHDSITDELLVPSPRKQRGADCGGWRPWSLSRVCCLLDDCTAIHDPFIVKL